MFGYQNDSSPTMTMRNIDGLSGASFFTQEHEKQQQMMLTSSSSGAGVTTANELQTGQFFGCNQNTFPFQQQQQQQQQQQNGQSLRSFIQQGPFLQFPMAPMTDAFSMQQQQQQSLTAESRTAALGDALEEIISMFDSDAFEPTPIRDQDSSLDAAVGNEYHGSSSMEESSSSATSSEDESTSLFFNSAGNAGLPQQQNNMKFVGDSIQQTSDIASNLDHVRHEAPADDGANGGDRRIIISDIFKPTNKNKRAALLRGADKAAAKAQQYSPKFRVYQKEKWWERYEELVEFFNKNGHSQVANTENANRALARWVKRQRYQFRLSLEGKPSSMTKDRIAALEKVNFVWDSHGAAWEDRLQELEDFKAKHKHCNVPSSYPENPSLASWVKCQRRQYRLFEAGEPTNITMDRIVQLGKMGFQWSLRMPQRI